MTIDTTNNPRVPRVAVITGASSGIGLAAAVALASQGWRIIGTGRDQARIASAKSQIQAVAAAGVEVEMVRVDLSLLRDARRAADAITRMTDRIDVLINNAGGTSKERILTIEGNEATFAGNHLGHFVLTQHLLPLIKATAANSVKGATRIINTSSSAHEYAPGLKWNDLQMLDGFVPMAAYCNVKLANILFSRELAARLISDGVVVHAMHPGAVDTNFIKYADEGTQKYMRSQALLSATTAADTMVWLASADEPGNTTAGYFFQRKNIPTSAAAKDDTAARQLWLESERLAEKALKEV